MTRPKTRINRRCVAFFVTLGLLVLAFAGPLLQLAAYAANDELHSHAFLIPVVTLYCLYVNRRQWPTTFRTDALPAIALAGIGLLALAALRIGLHSGLVFTEVDHLALTTFGFVTLLLAAVAATLGRDFLRAALFPLLFLYFLMPMPTLVNHWFTVSLQHTTAFVLPSLFHISGTPVARTGTIFMLPGLTLEVAEECSGIRSSLVLLITGLLSGYFVLNSRTNRTVLALAFFPIGVLRNAARILFVALMTLHVDPGIIDGPLHHSGGPPFFVLSLVPLFLLLWLMRLGERRSRAARYTTDKAKPDTRKTKENIE